MLTNFKLVAAVIGCLLATVLLIGSLHNSIAFGAQVSFRPFESDRNHVRYKLVDLGTFGGPNSVTQEELQVLNNRGMVAGQADTSIPNHPNSCIFCSSPFIFHAFQWRKAILTDLGALSGPNSSFANWLSESGLSAGFSESVALDPLLGIRQTHAALWRNGQITDLGTLEGGYESVAFTVNDRGQVAGVATNTVPDPFSLSGRQLRTFLWNRGRMMDLGTLGGPDAGFLGFKGNVEMNERGEVTACSYTSSTPNPATGTPTLDPFLWQNGRMLDLGSLGGTLGCSINLNNRGQVVGYSDLSGDSFFHPFLWDRGVLRDLGTLGGSLGFANSINDAGDVGGAAWTHGDVTHHAFLWRNGVMTDLGTLPGDSCSSVIAMNSRGDVVGQSFPCGGNFHAFLRENGGPMLDLNSLIPAKLGVSFVDAVGINNREEIVAWGLLPNGDMHAMVLIPCHEANRCENDVSARKYPSRALGYRMPPLTRRTPMDVITAWRERLAQRYHVPGLIPLLSGPGVLR